MTRIAVLGASGFVGSAVVEAARHAGHTVLPLRAPRLEPGTTNHERTVDEVAAQVPGVDVVINCAGNPDASSTRFEDLHLVNAVLPGVIGSAARRSGVPRYIHVSSAVVQGRRPVLDSTEATDAFSPYARSKVEGEVAARAEGPEATTVYRPPSVHAPTRRVTRQLTAIARSPLATVVAPGDRPTPQTHIRDVADALVFLATRPQPPPPVVHHPWQGHTTAGLLTALGDGRRPHQVPARLAHGLLTAGMLAARVVPTIGPYLRRVEMIWLGQEQARSWLETVGWQPTTTDADWARLGQLARATGSTHPTRDER